MKHTRTHTFHGRTVLPCSDVRNIDAGAHWYVQTTHGPSGLPYSEEHCPTFATLADAREWCLEDAAHEQEREGWRREEDAELERAFTAWDEGADR